MTYADPLLEVEPLLLLLRLGLLAFAPWLLLVFDLRPNISCTNRFSKLGALLRHHTRRVVDPVPRLVTPPVREVEGRDD